MGGNIKFTNFKSFLLEGGNVFAGKTGPIKKEWIGPTLKRYYADLEKIFPQHRGFTKTFKPVGSVGKKPYSGDIDLAIDSTTFFKDGTITDKELKSWGIDINEFQKEAEKTAKRARTSTELQTQFKAFMSLMAKQINKRSKTITADEKKITAGNLFGLYPQYDEKGKVQKIGVQIDWLVGNQNWLVFTLTSEDQRDNVKGLHRTQLILAAFVPKGMIFSQTQGVKIKETQEVVANTPTAAIDLINRLYKFNLNKSIIDSYFKLEEYFRKNLGKREYGKIMDAYMKILDSTRADIPNNIHQYWIDNQKRLRLTGKFLPVDSLLQSHIK